MVRRIAIGAGWLVLLIGVLAIRALPIWPGPVVPGAARLGIDTAGPHLLPHIGCNTALLGPVRVEPSGDELRFLSPETGEPVRIMWPSGWAAWRVGETAVLLARDGSLVAREGDVIRDRFGGGVYDDDVFRVCVMFG